MKKIGLLVLLASIKGFAETKKLTFARKEIMELGAKLHSLEKDLAFKNTIYLKKIEEIEKENKSLIEFENELTSLQDKVQRFRANNQKILRHYLVNEDRDVVGRGIYTGLAKENLEKLASEEKVLSSMNERATVLRENVQKLKMDEENLHDTIEDLENRKKQIMENYLTRVEARNELEQKIQEQKLTMKMSALKRPDNFLTSIKPSRLFQSPLKEYEKFITSEKGVTFKISDQVPLYATGEGRVVYTGELANFGKVLMIDHGDELRSVILGQFDATVVKDQIVKAGEILGQTTNSAQNPQPLYFEIRKKNTAQKTILWLDQASLSKI